MKVLSALLLGVGFMLRLLALLTAGHLRPGGDAVLTICLIVAAVLAGAVPTVLVFAVADRSIEQQTIVRALAALDPLSIAMYFGDCSDIVIGTSLSAAVAFAILAQNGSSPRTQKLGLGGCILALVIAGIGASSAAPIAADAVFLAWADFGPPWLARFYAIIHHAGYALVPLAIGALWIPAGRRIAWLLVPATILALLVDRGSIARFATLGVFAPILVAMAAQTLIQLRASATAEREGRLRALGLVLVVVAVNAPVLASDLVSRGPHFRFHDYGFKDGARAPIVSTAPEQLAHFSAEPLPHGAELADRLSRPFTIVLPIINGRLWRGDAEQLEAVERTVLPRRETRATRFDLYRFEIREYAREKP